MATTSSSSTRKTVYRSIYSIIYKKSSTIRKSAFIFYIMAIHGFFSFLVHIKCSMTDTATALIFITIEGGEEIAGLFGLDK